MYFRYRTLARFRGILSLYLRLLQRVRLASADDGGMVGENVRIGPNGYDIALLAAGGCIEAVDAVLTGRVDNAYALVRPCGHHAEADSGRGFCVFGNVVLAVRHAKAVRGIERVAVVDWDVHHGNGTEAAFYDDPSVLTISLHQERCYPPDSGALEDIGKGAGRGFALNLPLPPGSGHGAYLAALDRVVLPALQRFRPELIVVASGLDACVGDPLGRMLCHSETYRQMTRRLMQAAEALCGGRLALCHEGGYAPSYAPFCGLAIIEELSSRRTSVADPMLGWYESLGGQALQPHQAALLNEAAARLEGVAA